MRLMSFFNLKFSKDIRMKIGFWVLLTSLLLFLICFFFLEKNENEYKPIVQWNPWYLFIICISLTISASLIFDISKILFDNEEYKANKSVPEMVKKIRYRGVLFNNIAIILFLITLTVIIMSFYLFFKTTPINNAENAWVESISVKLGASLLLIFLVQILFKVFKYLLRVAAFYNGRADAIEYQMNDPKNTLSLDKLMDVFTPKEYDISELEKMSILDSIGEVVKAKIGK